MQTFMPRRLRAALVAVLLVAAPTAAPASAAVPAGSAVPACAPTVGSTQLLANGGLDGGSATLAAGWNDAAWGGAAVRMWRDPSHPRGGTAVQAVTVSSFGSGGALFAELRSQFLTVIQTEISYEDQ